MFITCNTYRQAGYAPDQLFSGVFGQFATSSSNSNSSVINFNPTVETVFTVGQTTTTFQSSGGTILIPGVAEGAVSIVGNSTQLTQSQVFSHAVEFVFVATFTSGLVTTHTFTAAFGVVSSVTDITLSVLSLAEGTSFALLGKSSFTHSTVSETTWTTGSLNTTVTSLAASNTFSTSSSGTGSTTSTTISDSISSTTAGAVLGTSIQTTITNTVTAPVNLTSTTTTNTTRTIWTMHLSVASTTTATLTTISTTGSSTARTITSTTTTTTGTPSWWGWSSERGTVFIATGNFSSNDLPAFLVESGFTSNLPGYWNYSTATQTTLWPPQPSTTVSQATSVNTSAIAHASIATLATSATFTVFGTATFTTTTSISATAPFSNADGLPSTASNPFPTIAQTVTSFSISTFTTSGIVTHSVNTTWNTTGATFSADIVTLILASTTFATSNGTFFSTVTLTTLVAGYTTASAATGDGITAVSSTFIITGPGLSVTTTTSQIQWFYDTSCPTQFSITASSSTSSSSTGANGQSNTGSSSTFSGSSQGFTRNLFSAPFVQFQHGSSLTTLASGSVTLLAPAAVLAWAAAPTMHGFSPWTATNSTFRVFSAPTFLPLLAFLPFETGRPLSYNSTGAAVTSTATGEWGIFGSPQTTTFSTTSTATASTTSIGTTTTTTVTTQTNLTSVNARTYSLTGSNASVTNQIAVSLPANGDQAGASFYFTQTFTTSTGTPSSSTTASSTDSSVGITYANAVTSTFVESYGYSSTLSITQTVSSLSAVTYSTGTAATATLTFLLITTGTVSSTSTYTTSWFPANTISQPTQIAIPGVGGYPKITGGAATIFACGAAVSLFSASAGSTFTWSTADPNFVQIVVGGNFTTSSSTTSAIGTVGPYTAYTIPGEFSVLTSPALLISTGQNKFVPAATLQTSFWPTPAPVLTPNNVLNR